MGVNSYKIAYMSEWFQGFYIYEFVWSLQVIEVSSILFFHFTDEETEGKEMIKWKSLFY